MAVCVAVACGVLASTADAGTSHRVRSGATVEAYGGLGSWLDIFAGSPWQHARSVVAELRAHDVVTLYLQTSNYSQRTDIVKPAALGRLLDSAHAAGLRVVAWYLPSFANPAVDARRSLAAIRFRSASGEQFDSFALDIEASLVHPVSLRNARLLALTTRLRAATPSTYPIGAIIPSPVGMARHPHYWPHFPYARLARLVDVFLPMAYFSHYVHKPSDVYAYTRRVVIDIRRQTGQPTIPIHVIGGIASAASTAAIAAFARAVSDCNVVGASLYAYPQTTPPEWQQLAKMTLQNGTLAPSCIG